MNGIILIKTNGVNMPEKLRPFHLAFPVKDLLITKEWYMNILGCNVGGKLYLFSIARKS